MLHFQLTISGRRYFVRPGRPSENTWCPIFDELLYNVTPPFGVVLPVYPPDYPRARSARGGRADKPQHHDRRWNKMFTTIDWSLLGNLRAREGGAVKFFQIRQATLASIRTRETGRDGA